MPTESRVMLLTGCASGIGRHLATVLAQAGHRLIATDIQAAQLAAEAARLQWPPEVQLRPLDVRDPAQWQEAVALALETWGRLDVLMNIAGYLLPGYCYEADPEQLARHLDINVKGTILGTQAAIGPMRQQKQGHIVNFSSLAGLVAVPGLSLYSASKAAVRSFSLAAAHELQPFGIAVTVVCPDAVRTPMLDLQAGYRQAALTFSGPRPLTVEDIARLLQERVLSHRPREVVLPWRRGWLAKLSNLWPGLAAQAEPLLQRRGLARQQRYRHPNDL